LVLSNAYLSLLCFDVRGLGSLLKSATVELLVLCPLYELGSCARDQQIELAKQ